MIYKATFHEGSVPIIIWLKAICSWVPLFIIDLLLVIIGVFIGPIVVLLLKKFKTNAFSDGNVIFNKTQYPDSSDLGWEFISIDPLWEVSKNVLKRFFWLFGNDKDGSLGDRRGFWSNKVKGKERSFWNKYWWLSIRNASNNAGRYTELLSCSANDCDFEYWYDYATPDDNPLVIGKHFVLATHRITGRKYYAYRNVFTLFKKFTTGYTGWAMNVVLGFKTKPSHADVIQPPSKTKGIVFRPALLNIENGIGKGMN